ncbi:MBL fold metallo-hydrolase [Methylicorpusculum oleiharenae]|uniref:rubredoxin-like domain-containing protein n=1 Tax=Methylicorpusculum oleiharenae TaxID=1338687 RepID=UPI001E601101|nr:MBL fold metallo-hydrolase [Methylicorpusculum oleiharenae]MCD2448803.1 MBL fold metallo-hydrolase [Methylicorpusculum oleiharenae]
MMDTPKFPEQMNQWVCLKCGYNMIGEMPDICPFCGAKHDQFMTWDEVEAAYRVTSFPVNDVVSQLLSVPKLGLEHAAYRIETETGAVWIDSPSAFNRELSPVKAILFTHHHFLGACNQYRSLWNSEVRLHELDAKHRLVTLFDIDRRFSEDYVAHGNEAYHVGGHTPGFTFYIYREVLFICDYVFLSASGMQFNPYGPAQETLKQAGLIFEIVKHKALKTVCGYNYVAHFADWLPKFEHLVLNR